MHTEGYDARVGKPKLSMVFCQVCKLRKLYERKGFVKEGALLKGVYGAFDSVRRP